MCTTMTGLRRDEKSSSSGVMVVLIPWGDVITSMAGTEKQSGCEMESTWAWIRLEVKLRYLYAHQMLLQAFGLLRCQLYINLRTRKVWVEYWKGLDRVWFHFGTPLSALPYVKLGVGQTAHRMHVARCDRTTP